MSALPQISEAEYEVMKIVWKYAPIMWVGRGGFTERFWQTRRICSILLLKIEKRQLRRNIAGTLRQDVLNLLPAGIFVL